MIFDWESFFVFVLVFSLTCANLNGLDNPLNKVAFLFNNLNYLCYSYKDKSNQFTKIKGKNCS